MNKKERVEAALRGDSVDRVPSTVWGHDYAREGNVQAQAEALIEDYTRYDWDFVKVTPRASYHVEGWKVKVRPADEKNKALIIEDTPIKSSSDWKRLRPLEPERPALNEQLRALQLINHGVGFEAYFVQTIFCPLGVAKYLVGNNSERVLQTMREDRKALHSALRVITETFTTFAIACLEEGASGIFYSTCGWASQTMLTRDQYREFGEQYDLEFLDAIKSRSKCNILYHSGERLHFDLFAHYPVHAVSWDSTRIGNPDLHEGERRIGKAVMGGLSAQTLKDGPSERIYEEIHKILELTGGQHLLLAPNSALLPETPARHLSAIRRVLS
jgi:uroporphyrinogen decarboxylase